MEKYTGLPDEWRDKEGNWHDGRNVYERKRDMLQHHAQECGCSQCKRAYEHYMERIEEDRLFMVSAIATIGLRFHLATHPEHTKFKLNMLTGDLEMVDDDYSGEDLIDLDGHEDGTE